MKRCPKCQRTYEDDSLNYCLDDGGLLISPKYDPQAPTLVMADLRTNLPTASLNDVALERIYRKLDKITFKLKSVELSCMDIFEELLPHLAVGASERSLCDRIVESCKGNSDYLNFRDEIGMYLAEIISPLVLNSLVEIHRPTDQVDQLYYLTDVGRRLAAYVEEKW